MTSSRQFLFCCLALSTLTGGAFGAFPEKLLGREARPGIKVEEPMEAMSEMMKGMMEFQRMIEKDSMVNAKALEALPSVDMSSFLDTLRSLITAKFELLSGLIGGIGSGSDLGSILPGLLGGSLLPSLPELSFPGLPSLTPGAQTA
ncbi:hypothetical protein BESB_014020 [Besnoitia besnoiti]|uniref:Transmembrane protein n=1 Tax=Besnoitia besnoiti TaxID=94643 RepID=A0A2A9MBL9_BESBE|nr:hypothetical protein BESB_014020 [Besnoitia besnoiti]PFH32790.1 hypothetical protein BESB_014020 [Besnoitia besnoiti]